MALVERRGGVGRAGQFQVVTGHVDDRHGHAVLGQCARLVGADDRHRTQRLDRRQLADERVAAQHALRAEGQRHGDDRRQPFGHDGHGHANGRQEHVARVFVQGDADEHDQPGDDHADQRQQLADAVEPPLERGR